MNERYKTLDMNNKLIWNFRDIGHTMRSISEGKGGRKRVLILLRENSPVTQRALTERLGIQPGSASEVIGNLEADGLLVRIPNGDDRRTADISLTEEGAKAAEEAYAQRVERHEKMFACLSENEKKTLLGLLEKVNASWDKEFRSGDGENLRKGHGHCGKV